MKNRNNVETIANFMGMTIEPWEEIRQPYYLGTVWYPDRKDKKWNCGQCDPKGVKDNLLQVISKVETDWNWAMEVYEKIVDWCDEQPVLDDNPFPTEGITEALCNPDLESFIEEMVIFIKWYNEQTTTEINESK